MLTRLPLRLLLTLPYAVLLLALASAVGWLSYRSADDAIDGMASKLHASSGERIQEATAAYLANWQYVLAAAQGDELSIPTVERRLWSAGALSSVRPSYVYFAAPDGRFVGVQRTDAGPALLKLRAEPGDRARQLFEIAAPADRTRALAPEAQPYRAPARPWYIAAASAQGDTWSPVYLDHSTRVPMVTLARAQRGSDAMLHGVYGADVPLAQLAAFLRKLEIAKQGLAYIVSRDGHLVASSLAPEAGHASKRELEFAAASTNAELVASYRSIADELQAGRATTTQAARVNTAAGRMLVSASPLRGQPGLDWWVVVALREDVVTAGIARNAWRTAILAGLAALAVLALGGLILRSFLGEVGALTRAAEHLSADQSPAPLHTRRRDELGRLSNAFDRMVERLTASTQTIKQQHDDLSRTVDDLHREAAARDEAEHRLRGVTDAMSEGFFVVDREWRVSYANKAAERYTQRSAEQIVGRVLWAVYPTFVGTDLERQLRRAWDDGRPRVVETFRERRRAWIELRLFPSPQGMAIFFSDVTQRRAVRDALAERQQQLERLAAELLTAQSEERRAIARELHDEMGQQLAALRINLQMLRAQAGDEADAERLDDSLAVVKQVIEQLRNRALDLHPAILDDLGLSAALQWLCERQAQRSGVKIALHEAEPLPALPPATALACFRIAQEAMANALKHAAPQHIDLTLGLVGGHLQLTIADDGCGTGIGATGTDVPRRSLGLLSMRERAEQLGGTIEFQSPHNAGTRVHLSIPLPRP